MVKIMPRQSLTVREFSQITPLTSYRFFRSQINHQHLWGFFFVCLCLVLLFLLLLLLWFYFCFVFLLLVASRQTTSTENRSQQLSVQQTGARMHLIIQFPVLNTSDSLENSTLVKRQKEYIYSLQRNLLSPHVSSITCSLQPFSPAACV